MPEIIASFGVQDYIALAVIAVAVAAAVYGKKRGKKGCNGCCGSCNLCNSCTKKDMEKNGGELSDTTGENTGKN